MAKARPVKAMGIRRTTGGMQDPSLEVSANAPIWRTLGSTELTAEDIDRYNAINSGAEVPIVDAIEETRQGLSPAIGDVAITGDQMYPSVSPMPPEQPWSGPQTF